MSNQPVSAVKIHTKKSPLWVNAAGDAVPVKFVPETDKTREALAAGIYKEALKVESALAALHALMNTATKEVLELVKKEYELKKRNHKGNITWYNFDKSIKIEADLNDIVKWDDALMTEALTTLNEYLESSLTDTNVLIKSIVNEAFSNSKGMIDSRKVFQLLKYENKIKDRRFLKACELIKQAQDIDKTKLYMRVWEKMNDGQYRNINLNFSSI